MDWWVSLSMIVGDIYGDLLVGMGLGHCLWASGGYAWCQVEASKDWYPDCFFIVS